jgi:hypothetical protein
MLSTLLPSSMITSPREKLFRRVREQSIQAHPIDLIEPHELFHSHCQRICHECLLFVCLNVPRKQLFRQQIGQI